MDLWEGRRRRQPQNTEAGHLYDAEGRRVQRSEGGTTRNFGYDASTSLRTGGDRVLLEATSPSAPFARSYATFSNTHTLN